MSTTNEEFEERENSRDGRDQLYFVYLLVIVANAILCDVIILTPFIPMMMVVPISLLVIVAGYAYNMYRHMLRHIECLRSEIRESRESHESVVHQAAAE